MGKSLKAQRRAVRRAQERAARREYKEHRGSHFSHFKCFWTPPLGHEWVNFAHDYEPDMRCVECKKPQPTTPPTSNTYRRP